MINMKVDEDNGKDTEMVNGRYQKFRRFSSNTFWKNISCFLSAPTFGIGGLGPWGKEEAQSIIKNNSKRRSISIKFHLY